MKSTLLLSLLLIVTLSSCAHHRPYRGGYWDKREDRWDRHHGPNGPLDRLEDRRDYRNLTH